MQPVSPIPHLPASAAVRGRHAPATRRAFQQHLEQAAGRLLAQGPAARGAAASTPGAAAARTSGVPALQPLRVRRLFPESVSGRAQRDTPRAVPPPGRDESHAEAVAIAPVRDQRTAALVARIHEVARRLGVDPAIGEAVARVESNLDPSARSPDGRSVGAFQMKRPTLVEMRRRLGRDRPELPLSDEVTLGIGYLRYLDGIFSRPTVLDHAGRRTLAVADPHERTRLAIAAYNAGEGAVAAAQQQAVRAGRDPRRFREVDPYLPPVTQRYVHRVLATARALGTGHEPRLLTARAK